MAILTAQQIRDARMSCLLLDQPLKRTPLQVAQWFGAMQSQDAASGHWSLGVRCEGSTEATILAAFESHAIVRTWPMRGTIHTVPAVDLRWMLELTGIRALTGAARRREQLGLTLQNADRAANVLADALRTTPVLTRAEAVASLAADGLDVAEQRSYHLLWYAAQIGVTYIGPQRGSDQTFVLIEDWSPKQVQLTRTEALTELLFRFVRSHGPVGLREFVGWTGLTLGDAKVAAAANAGRLRPLASEVGEVWVTEEAAARIAANELTPPSMVVLPGFDEFMLGYKDRSLHVPAGGMDRIVPGGNGMFRATVVADGMAIATWKRTLKGDRVAIEVEPFINIKPALSKRITAAFTRYGHFLGKEPDVRFAAI